MHKNTFMRNHFYSLLRNYYHLFISIVVDHREECQKFKGVILLISRAHPDDRVRMSRKLHLRKVSAIAAGFPCINVRLNYGLSKMNIRAGERKYDKPERFSTRKSHGNSPGARRIKFSIRISDGNTGRVKFTLAMRIARQTRCISFHDKRERRP